MDQVLPVAHEDGVAEADDEPALIELARTDAVAFAELYRRYLRRVFHYVLTYADTVEDAADLTQYVFLRALEALPNYRDRGLTFAAWLFRIARNAALDTYRRRRKTLPWDHLPAAWEPFTDHDPEGATLRRESLNQLRLLVAQLDPEKQEMLYLRFAGELTAAEIGAVVGKSEAEARVAYPHLIGAEDDDAAAIRLIRDLDAGLKAIEPPPALWSAVPKGLPGGAYVSSVPEGLPSRLPLRRIWLRSMPVLVALLVLALLAVATFAVSKGTDVTDLGRPTNDVPPHNPLGAFHRIGTNLSQHGKPELLFIGTQVDQNSAAERWPIVKALDQFGTWSGVEATIARGCAYWTTTTRECVQYKGIQGYPTFDLGHARYSSRYLVLTDKELMDQAGHVQQPLTPLELSLFDRYAAVPGSSSWHDTVWRTAMGGSEFPLILVGGYLETNANLAIPGDLTPSTSVVPLPFSTIQQSLQRGRAIGKAPYSLVPDFNAESNVITALICHADHLQPKSVCSRPPIRTIPKHVK